MASMIDPKQFIWEGKKKKTMKERRDLLIQELKQIT